MRAQGHTQSSSSFQRFRDLTRRLMAVPKQEVADKIAKAKAAKKKTKRT